MAKKTLAQRETNLTDSDGRAGRQLEQTLMVDDNALPSPADLEAYKNVDPKIVDFILGSASKEQEYRHLVEKGKINIVQSQDRREGRMNWWGMFFAFLSIVVMVGAMCYALYLDKPWFAASICGATLITVVSIFTNKRPFDAKYE